MESNLAKDLLRREMRSALIAAHRADAAAMAQRSQQICRNIQADPAWAAARVVCAFLPLSTEPQITPLLSASPAPRMCFPRLCEGAMELVCIDDAELLPRATWRMDLAEFDRAEKIALADVDLVLTPGLAFTRSGGRMGRGGGFYDRLLAQRPARLRTLGVCFELQIVESLPQEDHDFDVDAVVTERG